MAANDTSAPGDPDGTLDTYEHFFYTGQQVVETRDASSPASSPESLDPHFQYVWSARYVDAAVLRDENTDADGACDDGRVYYLTDANFNVTALTDASGTVVERYVYDPYGKVTIYDDDWSDTRSASAEDNTRLYTGRELDEATGLYYYRARWYDTGTGQFLSRDPLGFAAGDANLYRYVGNRPVGSTDRSGLWEDSGSGGSGGVQWDPRSDYNYSGPVFGDRLFPDATPGAPPFYVPPQIRVPDGFDFGLPPPSIVIPEPPRSALENLIESYTPHPWEEPPEGPPPPIILRGCQTCQVYRAVRFASPVHFCHGPLVRP